MKPPEQLAREAAEKARLRRTTVHQWDANSTFDDLLQSFILSAIHRALEAEREQMRQVITAAFNLSIGRTNTSSLIPCNIAEVLSAELARIAPK